MSEPARPFGRPPGLLPCVSVKKSKRCNREEGMRAQRLLTAVAGLAMFAALGWGGAIAQTRTTLDIYVVDVEGGNATLFVAPSGESVLIDTGNGAAAAPRDAERILDAAHDAGL